MERAEYTQPSVRPLLAEPPIFEMAPTWEVCPFVTYPSLLHRKSDVLLAVCWRARRILGNDARSTSAFRVSPSQSRHRRMVPKNFYDQILAVEVSRKVQEDRRLIPSSLPVHLSRFQRDLLGELSYALFASQFRVQCWPIALCDAVPVRLCSPLFSEVLCLRRTYQPATHYTDTKALACFKRIYQPKAQTEPLSTYKSHRLLVAFFRPSILVILIRFSSVFVSLTMYFRWQRRWLDIVQ